MVKYTGFEQEFISQIPNESLDGTFIDPPYTDGKGKDVLSGHRIQTKVDIQHITNEIYRTQKKDTFYAVFGQMPTILAWHNAAINAGFVFKIQIIWNKKNGNVRQLGQLENITELIWIYKKGKPKFNKVNAPYEEQVRMNIDNGSKIDSIFRELSYWKGIAQGKELANTVQPNKQRNDKIYDRGIYERSSRVLGRETGNIKNIWAYSSHNLEFRTEISGGKVKHPSVKPIPLLERLIELLTPDVLPCGCAPLIADWYIGSGTSALAALRTKRRFIGTELFDFPQEQETENGLETFDGYFTISKKRIITEDKIINSTLKF